MQNYLDLLNYIITNGVSKTDRTGVGTFSIFGYQLRFNLQKGFPLITTKKIHLKSIIYELLWLLKGDTNIKYLNDNGVSIWNEWADEQGSLGPVYGKQWRHWEDKNGKVTDQISEVIKEIKTNPDSRRLLVSAWNVGDLPKMKLQPCHVLFQFYVNNNTLSCHLYQRSADVFLGLPFNIASYSLLTCMMAQVCHLLPGELIHSIGDAHLYKNHLEVANIQLKRQPLPLPYLKLNPEIKDIFSFNYSDISFENYQYHPALKAEVAI